MKRARDSLCQPPGSRLAMRQAHSWVFFYIILTFLMHVLFQIHFTISWTISVRMLLNVHWYRLIWEEYIPLQHKAFSSKSKINIGRDPCFAHSLNGSISDYFTTSPDLWLMSILTLLLEFVFWFSCTVINILGARRLTYHKRTIFFLKYIDFFYDLNTKDTLVLQN